MPLQNLYTINQPSVPPLVEGKGKKNEEQAKKSQRERSGFKTHTFFSPSPIQQIARHIFETLPIHLFTNKEQLILHLI
jgi:hypothetical protein